MGKPNTATCSSQLVLGVDGKAPEWVQLFPSGTFKTNDGRTFTLQDAGKVIAASKSEIHFDYDHGTDERNDSRAAGWSTELKATGPNGQPGLWAHMKWNKAGAAAIEGHEYRFLSPTFAHDKQNNVTRILRAGLVNNPAIDELPALASEQENELENIKQIAVALGLPDTATVSDIISAISTAKSNSTALCKNLGEVATAAGLTVAGDKVGETELTAICAMLKAQPSTGGDEHTIATLSAQVTELRTRILELTAKDLAKTAEQKVADAIAGGKLAPAQKEDALALCKSDPAAFDKFIGSAPAIVTAGRQARQDLPADELTEEQKALCAKMDVKEDDFKAQLKARKEAVA